MRVVVGHQRFGKKPVADADLNYEQIGRRIAAQRTLLGMTQRALAIQAGVSQTTIALLERGRRTGIQVNTLTNIARVLGVTREYLLTGNREGMADE